MVAAGGGGVIPTCQVLRCARRNIDNHCAEAGGGDLDSVSRAAAADVGDAGAGRTAQDHVVDRVVEACHDLAEDHREGDGVGAGWVGLACGLLDRDIRIDRIIETAELGGGRIEIASRVGCHARGNIGSDQAVARRRQVEAVVRAAAGEVVDRAIAGGDVARGETSDALTEGYGNRDGGCAGRVSGRGAHADRRVGAVVGTAELRGGRVEVASIILRHTCGNIGSYKSLTGWNQVKCVVCAAASKVADRAVAGGDVACGEARDALAEGHADRDGRDVGRVAGRGCHADRRHSVIHRVMLVEAHHRTGQGVASQVNDGRGSGKVQVHQAVEVGQVTA